MTQQALNESQEEIAQSAPQPGTSDQVNGTVVEPQPGVDGVSVNTYTQEEWDSREKTHIEERANADRQVNQARQTIADSALRQQIAIAEAQYQARDRQAVDDGEITESQAQQRQQTRYQQWQEERTRQQTVTRDKAEHAKLVAESEEMARWKTADLLSKEHGVDMAVLLSDKSLTSGEKMEIKAQRLALDRERAGLKGFESYDSGQVGTSRSSLDSMSPEEKIAWALAHPPKRSRN
jgi:hypothetical protein